MAQQDSKSGTHWRKVHRRLNEHLLFAEDLGGFGAKPLDVEISDSGIFAVKGQDGSKDMPWLAFRGADGKERAKKLGLNVGNCKTMQTLTGSGIVQDWRGWITLLVVRTTYSDSKTKERIETDAIRIAPKRPQSSRRQEPPSSPSANAPSTDAPALSDEERRAIEMAEREEAGRG